jgi:transglutaminase-like putative cysteine protease
MTVTAGARRLRIVHRTGYRYGGLVAASYNEARMTPSSCPRQSVLAARVSVNPVTWTYAYRDYWGSQVTAFDVITPHRELAVVSSSTVEVHPVDPGPRGVGWEALRRREVRDGLAEYLTPAGVCRPAEEVMALAEEAADGLAPAEAARAVCERLRSQMDYMRGATGVWTDAVEVWRARQGVCQDFAHLSLGALRSLGIPARYVSGYLHPHMEAPIGEMVEGESHAWVEWWVGEWVGFDPTSLSPAGADHVVVARGRDYPDVTPLKGIYAGPCESELFVSVEVTRLA